MSGDTHRPLLGPPTVLAKKVDLEDRASFDEVDLKAVAGECNAPYAFTSAKAGENVQRPFGGSRWQLLAHPQAAVRRAGLDRSSGGLRIAHSRRPPEGRSPPRLQASTS